MAAAVTSLPAPVIEPKPQLRLVAKKPVNPWVVALTVTLATFMELLDTSIANVSLPYIAGGLGRSYDEVTWILTTYLVANAVVLPMSAWLSRVLGRKNYYLLCVALFTVTSFLCGIAPSLEIMLVARVLQGIGGGGLAPVEQAILVDTFPAAQARFGFRALHRRDRDRAGHRTGPRRLDHRQLQLALGLPDQYPHRLAVDVPDHALRPRSAGALRRSAKRCATSAASCAWTAWASR